MALRIEKRIMAMEQRSDKDMMWKTLQSEYLIKRPWLTARRDTVQLPNGKIYDEYYVLEYPTWVNVIAETKDGNLILERQYRHATEIISTEICAGVAEEGETPLEAAKRELMEETGFGGGEWTEIMTTCPNPGTMTNYCHCFLARGVEKRKEQNLDNTEDIEVFLAEKKEVLTMLEQNVFKQAMMIAPLWKYFTMGL